VAPRPAFSISTRLGTWQTSMAWLSKARICARERTGVTWAILARAAVVDRAVDVRHRRRARERRVERRGVVVRAAVEGVRPRRARRQRPGQRDALGRSIGPREAADVDRAALAGDPAAFPAQPRDGSPAQAAHSVVHSVLTHWAYGARPPFSQVSSSAGQQALTQPAAAPAQCASMQDWHVASVPGRRSTGIPQVQGPASGAASPEGPSSRVAASPSAVLLAAAWQPARKCTDRTRRRAGTHREDMPVGHSKVRATRTFHGSSRLEGVTRVASRATGGKTWHSSSVGRRASG
jgi:hypothetical protein